MAESVEVIRDFLLHLDRSLATRRLYARDSDAHRGACERVFEQFVEAASEGEFTLRVGPTDLFIGKTSVLNRDKREDSFFFPLYRDGLRELSFSPGLTPEELDQFLCVLEAERDGVLGLSQDTISFLWRCDLSGITFKAIDGIGDEEGEGVDDSGTEDYRSLVADLLSKIQDPAAPSTGQSYSFRIDADTRIGETDLHYEATTAHRSFEENPAVLSLASEEVNAIRAAVEEETEEELLKRFTEVLFVMLADSTGTVAAADLGPVFTRLLTGLWKTGDYSGVSSLAARLHTASQGAPLPETREAARGVVRDFITSERIGESFDLLQTGALPLERATELWELIDEDLWDCLIDLWCALPGGALREGTTGFIRERASASPDLVRRILRSERAEPIRAGLSLIDEAREPMFAAELLDLASHPDPSIRLKGVSAAARIGGDEALDVLWRVIESDGDKSARLLAFRVVADAKPIRLAGRIRALVTSAGFASRPLAERVRYARLLGTVAGDTAYALFDGWIPRQRWMWKRADLETAELAMCGLAGCGDRGLDRVRTLAAEKGKLAELARKVLGSRGTAPARGSKP